MLIATTRNPGDDGALALDYRTDPSDPRGVGSDFRTDPLLCQWRVVAPTSAVSPHVVGHLPMQPMADKMK
ncbi:hypothetical protein OG948_37015 (plasmid) [Embleya sp. NBC_00888]|uniref:hypothetical protein n=1 Tax=Embleya sp. NBC_00888 TaxID=2975960 RepID=UPI0038709A91|nr:hypothetical protein OG948_37015 [Embleya sp. NBC_00888]